MSEITTDALDIRFDTSEEKIFFQMKGDAEAYLKYKLHTKHNPNVMEFVDMHIPEVLSGIGLEKAMGLEALKFADINNYKIKTTHPFMSGYLNNHPEYHYLKVKN